MAIFSPFFVSHSFRLKEIRGFSRLKYGKTKAKYHFWRIYRIFKLSAGIKLL